MLDRLRVSLNRPINDGDRRRLFAITVVLLLGAAATLSILDEPATPARSEPTPAPATRSNATPPASPLPALATPATTHLPSEESDLQTNLRASAKDVAHSKRAARRFLTRYLPYAYGRSSASKITAATPELRAQLARQRPRVPATEQRRTARVELLQSDSVTHERAELLAVITDDARRYTVHLQLANTPTGWLVTALER